MSEHIITKSENGVFHIIFNRSEKRNALTRAMYAKIGESIDKAEKDPNILVMLIYGKGKCFCAGNDLKDFQDVDRGTSSTQPTVNWVEMLLSAKKPIIGAVHGYAIGVGVTMLLQFPFVNLGLVPEIGSTFNLPALIGYQRAAELFFFGDWFTAEEAEKMGMINKIFSESELIDNVIKLAEKLAEKPPGALKKTKELIKKHQLSVLSKLMPEEMIEFSRSQKSPEAQEAFRAFFEDRKPDFSKFR
jgi:enoyl-CoA hydratase/carnithine racemase